MKWTQIFNPLAWIGFIAGVFVVLLGVLAQMFVAYAKGAAENAVRARAEKAEAAAAEQTLPAAASAAPSGGSQVVSTQPPAPQGADPSVATSDDDMPDVDMLLDSGPPAWVDDPWGSDTPVAQPAPAPSTATPTPAKEAAPKKAKKRQTCNEAPEQMAFTLVERKTPAPAQKKEQAAPRSKQARYRGTLLSAKWDQRPDDKSGKLIRQFCVRYLDGTGNLRSIWGNDLRNALQDAGAKCEDRVDIRWLGMEPVVIPDPEHPGRRKEVERNKWVVRIER